MECQWIEVLTAFSTNSQLHSLPPPALFFRLRQMRAYFTPQLMQPSSENLSFRAFCMDVASECVVAVATLVWDVDSEGAEEDVCIDREAEGAGGADICCASKGRGAAEGRGDGDLVTLLRLTPDLVCGGLALDSGVG